MSDALADALRAARMQFVSLDKRHDGTWEATYRGRNRNDMRSAIGDDPVAALADVLKPRAKSASKKLQSVDLL